MNFIQILGIRYDKTSDIKGQRFAPLYIRRCFDLIEDFSFFKQKSLSWQRIKDLGDIRNPKAIGKVLNPKQKFVAIGGEHTISYFILKELKKFYQDIVIFHFDAHLDSKDIYKNKKLCNATVIKRISEFFRNIYHIGIRSCAEDEKPAGEIIPVDESLYKRINQIIETSEKFYLTIDLDVLDPSIMSAVVYPEIFGLSVEKLLNIIQLFKNKFVIGFDIVELNPRLKVSFSSSMVAAELIREIILTLWESL